MNKKKLMKTALKITEIIIETLKEELDGKTKNDKINKGKVIKNSKGSRKNSS